jgi:hypothetical protein
MLLEFRRFGFARYAATLVFFRVFAFSFKARRLCMPEVPSDTDADRTRTSSGGKFT